MTDADYRAMAGEIRGPHPAATAPSGCRGPPFTCRSLREAGELSQPGSKSFRPLDVFIRHVSSRPLSTFDLGGGPLHT